MPISTISLTEGMRNSLLTLQGHRKIIDRTQQNLATGRKVTSPLDNPTNFFASKAHLDRAVDLTALKTGFSEAINTIRTADLGITGITSLLQAAKGLTGAAAVSSSSKERYSFGKQFDRILAQIDSLAGDSVYKGTDLLNGDKLTVTTNENGSSSLEINGFDSNASSLGIARVTLPGEASTFSAGTTFGMAINSSNGVVAWGTGTPASTVPSNLQSGVTAVSAGYWHALALKGDGSLFAWGDDSSGQSTVPANAQTGVSSMAAGINFSIALKSDGTVVTWGSSANGVTTIPSSAQSGIISVAAGYRHALALTTEGSVVAWGENTFGQSTVPASAMSGVVAISGGFVHSLALKSDGSVVAWGFNGNGQTSVPAAAQSGVIAIAAGLQSSIALKSDGSVVQWGVASALPASLQSGVVAISSYEQFSLALKDDGSLISWGTSLYGGTTIPASVQSGVPFPSLWTTADGIKTSETQLTGAIETLRSKSDYFSSTLDVISTRQNFSEEMTGILQTGADNLTLADMNEEGANLLMLEAQQNLALTELKMSAQSSEKILQLF